MAVAWRWVAGSIFGNSTTSRQSVANWMHRRTTLVIPPSTTLAFCLVASHCTGDIHIHEMAFVNSETENAPHELVFVNTAFSCLAKRSEQNSFEPIWRPKWIEQMAPGDNCHLNGLAAQDGLVAMAGDLPAVCVKLFLTPTHLLVKTRLRLPRRFPDQRSL